MKKKKSIRSYLLKQHFFVITITVALFEIAIFIGLYHYYYKNTEEILASHAKNAVHFAMRSSELSPFQLQYHIPEMINDYQLRGTEMQIVSPSGNILASSSGFLPDEVIEHHILQQATIERPTPWKGKNPSSGERVMAVVVPLENGEETIAYFRYVTSLERMDIFFKRQLSISLGVGGVIILLVLLLSMAFSKQMTTPLTRLTKASKRLARGEFDARIHGDYIGELDTLAKSFNEMSHALLQHEKMKDEFISSVSHELRTPLTSIKGWSDTLLTGDLNDIEEVELGLNVISKETSRLTNLVEELLDFSALKNESYSLQPTTFPVKALLNEILTQFKKQTNKKQLTLSVTACPDVHIHADKNRIKQVLINLVDNAMKHSPSGSDIELSGRINEGSFVFSVIDEGDGMDELELEKIMAPFYKANPNTVGAGLGLSICQHIIDLHHGEFLLESKRGEGMKVSFSIPFDSHEIGG